MPLPPRDMTRLHESLNPNLLALHARHPLAKYVPSLGLFRLYQLEVEGLPLADELDEPSWMTLACLDDRGAHECLCAAAVAMKQGLDAQAVNRALAVTSAPFLVPMLVPAPSTTFVINTHEPHFKPAAADHAPTPGCSLVTHVSDSDAADASDASDDAAASNAADASDAAAVRRRFVHHPKPRALTTARAALSGCSAAAVARRA